MESSAFTFVYTVVLQAAEGQAPRVLAQILRAMQKLASTYPALKQSV